MLHSFMLTEFTRRWIKGNNLYFRFVMFPYMYSVLWSPCKNRRHNNENIRKSYTYNVCNASILIIGSDWTETWTLEERGYNSKRVLDYSWICDATVHSVKNYYSGCRYQGLNFRTVWLTLYAPKGYSNIFHSSGRSSNHSSLGGQRYSV